RDPVLATSLARELRAMRLAAVPVAGCMAFASCDLRLARAIRAHRLRRQATFRHAASTADVAIVGEPPRTTLLGFRGPLGARRVRPFRIWRRQDVFARLRLRGHAHPTTFGHATPATDSAVLREP